MLRRLIACCASTERPLCCVVGSSRGGLFQCNFSAERVRREATAWSDKGSWLLVWVRAVCWGPLKRCLDANMTFLAMLVLWLGHIVDWFTTLFLTKISQQQLDGFMWNWYKWYKHLWCPEDKSWLGRDFSHLKRVKYLNICSALSSVSRGQLDWTELTLPRRIC